MKYLIYINNFDDRYEKGSQRVFFEDGTNYATQEDDDGNKYFPIYNTSDKGKFRLFTDCITDAIMAIRDGHGDALKMGNIFGGITESVIRFIDREYGEKIRNKTIKGFEDTEFGYSLKFGYLNSFKGSLHVKRDYTLLSLFDEDLSTSMIYFKTEAEAQQARDSIISKANDLVKEYRENQNKSDLEISKLFEEKWKGIYSDVAHAILGEVEEKWKLKIVQAVKPKNN